MQRIGGQDCPCGSGLSRGRCCELNFGTPGADALVLSGTTAGTLDGMGSQFTGSAKLTETDGAGWTLTNDGTLTNVGAINGGTLITSHTIMGGMGGHDTFAFFAANTTSAHVVTIEYWQASGTPFPGGFSAAAGGGTATVNFADGTAIQFIGASPTSHSQPGRLPRRLATFRGTL